MTSDEQAVLAAVDKAKQNSRLIIALCVGGALLGILYTVIVPPRWMGKTKLFVTIPEQGTGAGGGLAAVLTGGPTNPYAGALAGLLGSHKTMTEVSEKTGLDMDRLDRVYDVELDRESSQIVISLEHKDQTKALEGLKTAVWRLQSLSQNLDIDKATREAREYGKAVVSAQEQLALAQQKLLAYQRIARTVPDPEQPFLSVAYVKNYENLKAELGAVSQRLKSARELAGRAGTVSGDVPTASLTAEEARKELGKKRIELAQAEALFRPDSPEVQALRRQVDEIRNEVESEVENFLTSVNKGTDPAIAELEAKKQVLEWQVSDAETYAKSAPSEAVQYQGLISDVQVASTLLETVRARHEQAKIESEVEKIRWTVLDPPYIESEPVNKSYPRNISLGVLLGLVVSALVVWIRR